MRHLLATLPFLLLSGAVQAAPLTAEERSCLKAVAAAERRAATLPRGDLSRRFAENDLATARTEMAAGEVDECPELVERALHTIKHRPYRLRPGETAHGYGSGG